MQKLYHRLLLFLATILLIGCGENSVATDSETSCNKNSDGTSSETRTGSDVSGTPPTKLTLSDCGPGLYLAPSGTQCVPAVCDLKTGILQDLLEPVPEAEKACVTAAGQWAGEGAIRLREQHFEQGTRVLVLDLHRWLGGFCWDCPQSNTHCPCVIRMVEVDTGFEL